MKKTTKKMNFFRRAFHNLYPDYIYENVESIPYEMIKKENIKAILLDMDNTLVNFDEAYKEGVKIKNTNLKNWAKNMKKNGIELYVFSNCPLEDVVKRIAKEFGMHYFFKVGKPKLKGFETAFSKLNLEKESILMVGDQIFTDVWGGNRFGIKTALVTPITDKEWIGTKVKRPFERAVINHYLKRRGDKKK